MKKFLSGLAASVLVALSACGGGGDAGAPAAPAAPPSVGGLWGVAYTAPNGISVQGRVLVAEDGRFFGSSLNLSNNCVALTYGSLSSTGNSFSGSATSAIAQFSVGASLPNCTFADGTVSATSALSGSFVQRTSLTLTSTGTTSGGLSLGTDTRTLAFDALYNVPSSLAAISGSWTGAGGGVVTVSASGQLSSTDPASGCVLSGQVSIINPSYNAYSATGGIAGCRGSSASLNGAVVRSLLSLDNTAVPNRLIVGQELTLVGGAKLVLLTTSTR